MKRAGLVLGVRLYWSFAKERQGFLAEASPLPSDTLNWSMKDACSRLAVLTCFQARTGLGVPTSNDRPTTLHLQMCTFTDALHCRPELPVMLR